MTREQKTYRTWWTSDVRREDRRLTRRYMMLKIGQTIQAFHNFITGIKYKKKEFRDMVGIRTIFLRLFLSAIIIEDITGAFDQLPDLWR